MMQKENKVLIVLGTIVQGGAHRVALMQANELSEMGYEVTLLSIVKPNKEYFALSRKVQHKYLFPQEDVENSGIKSKIYRRSMVFIKLPLYMKKNRPDIVISHIQGTNREAIISSFFNGIPIIACEHTSHHLPKGLKGSIAKFERRFIYKLASKITVLTEYDRNTFYSKYIDHVEVMRNPCPFPISLNKDQVVRDKTILAVGDLNRINIKGWDTLLKVAKRVKENGIVDWKFKIAGGGAEGFDILTRMITENNLDDIVELLGPISDIKNLYKTSSVFILTSRNEGLPMSLIEAMSQGCASIAFDCITGPSDIIDNNVNGILVENQNIDMMVNGVISLIKDSKLRSDFSEKSISDSKIFSLESVMNDWDFIIQDTLKRHG